MSDDEHREEPFMLRLLWLRYCHILSVAGNSDKSHWWLPKTRISPSAPSTSSSPVSAKHAGGSLSGRIGSEHGEALGGGQAQHEFVECARPSIADCTEGSALPGKTNTGLCDDSEQADPILERRYQCKLRTLITFIWGPDGWLYGCHGVFTHSNVGKPGTPEGTTHTARRHLALSSHPA